MNVEWKDVVGYEGMYKVNNIGEIKSLYKNIILIPQKDRYGYLYVNLYNKKTKKSNKRKIHRLVAMAFIANEIKENNCINHIDENKENNMVENLEWCDVYYNNHYNNRYKLLEKEIKQFYPNGEFIKYWKSAKQASVELNIPPNNITKNCKRKSNIVKGFVFRYSNEDF